MNKIIDGETMFLDIKARPNVSEGLKWSKASY